MNSPLRQLLVVIGLVAGLFVAMAVLLVRDSLRARVTGDLDAELKARAFALSRLVETRSPRLMPYIEQGLGTAPGGVFLQIFDADGNSIAYSSNLDAPIPLSDTVRRLAAERFEAVLEDSRSSSGEATRVATFARAEASPGKREVGFFAQAGIPLASRAQHSERITFALVVGGVTLWCILLGIAWLFIRRWRASLRGMTKQVASLDLASLHPNSLTFEARDLDVAELASAIQRLLGRLADTHDAQQQFVAEASHELRTPLAILLGENDVALRRERTAAEYRETLQSNREEIARLSRIVDNLLTLARADAGEPGPLREPLNLHTLCGEVCDQLGPVAEGRRVALALESCPSDPVECVGDRLALHRAVFNIVENAISACPGGESVKVDVSFAGGIARVTVVDTGIGIAPEQMSRIFDRFYRTDAARARGSDGAGLGLAIVKSIVESHRGSVAVQSAPGCGSTFTISLPCMCAAGTVEGGCESAG